MAILWQTFQLDLYIRGGQCNVELIIDWINFSETGSNKKEVRVREVRIRLYSCGIDTVLSRYKYSSISVGFATFHNRAERMYGLDYHH